MRCSTCDTGVHVPQGSLSTLGPIKSCLKTGGVDGRLIIHPLGSGDGFSLWIYRLTGQWASGKEGGGSGQEGIEKLEDGFKQG